MFVYDVSCSGVLLHLKCILHLVNIPTMNCELCWAHQTLLCELCSLYPAPCCTICHPKTSVMSLCFYMVCRVVVTKRKLRVLEFSDVLPLGQDLAAEHVLDNRDGDWNYLPGFFQGI